MSAAYPTPEERARPFREYLLPEHLRSSTISKTIEQAVAHEIEEAVALERARCKRIVIAAARRAAAVRMIEDGEDVS